MLKIVNPDKMVGRKFVKDRFVCIRTTDVITHWKFQLEDLKAPFKRFLLIEVDKVGRWDNIEQKWMYDLKYPDCPPHKVSLDYFGKFDNALETFEMALKEVR